MADDGVSAILLSSTTSPQDINGMIVSAGVVTALGGRASHAAVVARGMGKPAVCGVEGMSIDHVNRAVTFESGIVIKEGEIITVSGDQGIVFRGGAEFSDAEPDTWLTRFLTWCDERATVPIVFVCPTDVDIVSEPEDYVPGMSRVLIDVHWEGIESASLLDRICSSVFGGDHQPSQVYICMPDNLAGIDFRPTLGPWSGIVAHENNTWAARLLSCRLTSSND
jgi:phosphohistidine swiveling domain-containing protein